MIEQLNMQQIISAFIVLFAVIDIIGSIPIIISLKQSGKEVNATKAAVYSGIILLVFFYVGEGVLQLFGVDINSFAGAGAIIIFLVSIEMLLDVELFKNNAELKTNSIIPLVFPLIAGAGSFTTLISLRAEYADINIIIGLILNMLWVFFVINMTGRIEKAIGRGGIYMLRKFFGIILLAIAIKLFTSNFAQLFQLAE
ncbi:MAG: MarC family protein [Muribaculaceae bacterium]